MPKRISSVSHSINHGILVRDFSRLRGTRSIVHRVFPIVTFDDGALHSHAEDAV